MTAISMQRDAVISSALRKIGVLSEGQAPSASQITDASLALNVIVKSLDSNPMLKFFIKSTIETVSTANGTADYALSDTTAWVEHAFVRVATNVDLPLEILTAKEYAAIPDKARPGIPTKAFVTNDRNIPGVSITPNRVYLWPVPNDTMTVGFIVRRKAGTMNSGTSYIDLPDEWMRYVILQLASDLSSEYRLSLEERQLHEVSAQMSLATIMQNQNNPVDERRVQPLEMAQLVTERTARSIKQEEK